MNWQYVDRDGNPVIKNRYLNARPFRDGIACAQDASGFGWIDKTGSFLTDKRFATPFSFISGVARVEVKNKYGIIDADGNWIVSPKLYDAGNYGDGLIWGKKGVVTQYFDSRGEIAFEILSGRANDFSCGRAMVSQGGKVCYLDSNGQEVTDKFDYGEDYSDGLAYVERGGKSVFIGLDGQAAFESNFEWVAPYFSDGRVLFRAGDSYGFADQTGAVVIEPEFDDAESFSDKVAVVKQGKKVGFISRNGEVVFMDEWNVLESCSSGVAVFGKTEKKLGFCDARGKVIVEPKYQVAGRFSEECCNVMS